MRKLLLLTLPALALGACASLPNVPASPAVVANSTVLDEQAAAAPELLYKAFRLAVETAVDAGIVKGETATRLREINTAAHNATLKAQAAYRIGNASDYNSALLQLGGLITAGNSLIGAHK